MKVRFTVRTKNVGSQVEDIVEIPDEDLEGLTEDEIIKFINNAYDQWLFEQENIISNWEILEE